VGAGFDRPALRALYDKTGRSSQRRSTPTWRPRGRYRRRARRVQPKVTGWQTVEDMLPLAAANSDRIKVAANINPHCTTRWPTSWSVSSRWARSP